VIACGRVLAVGNGLVDAIMPPLALGSTVEIDRRLGTVCAAHERGVTIRMHGTLEGIVRGTAVRESTAAPAALGIGALGRRIDASEGTFACETGPRAPVDRPLFTGVRAIDALLTIGRGARVGIFGSPGAGKSTLLETIVRGTAADAVVLGLVGERGREAHAWLACLDRRTTIVCATSDRPAAQRVAAAHTALAQANALAARGLHVLLLLDSLARVAAALRECALAAGEPAGRGGYPPSVFASMAHLCERAGSFAFGSITMIATVLSEGDDRDPVSESARSLLDGHIVLSPSLARAGRFPAIDVVASASRTMDAVTGPEHRRRAGRVRAALARLDAMADARALGVEASDPWTLAAVTAEPAIERLLRQGRDPVPAPATLEALRETADTLGVAYEHCE
jgi:type III secretion protein N (ATPase)